MTVTISTPDKVLWPSARITKADLADYYEAVADRLLPELEGRATTLRHHPRGVDAEGFMRKDLPDHAPDSVGRWAMWAPTARRTVTYAVIESVDALRWCAGQNVTEFHPCLFRVDRPERLDTVVFDLDPGDDPGLVGVAAASVREELGELGLAASVKTSGGRGLHVLVAVERRYETHRLRSFAEQVAGRVAARFPDEMTTEFHKADRRGRLFLDCTRVGLGATTIAAWSPRARDVPTVATPLSWDEVGPDLDVDAYTQEVARSRPPIDRPSPQRLESALAALRCA